MRSEQGFTLIELLIAITVIGILTSIAVPSYVGMQNRGRVGAMKRVASATIPELQGWINAVKKANTPLGPVIEIDTNGDRALVAPDLDNNALAAAGVVTTFIASRTDFSPWNSALPLWVNGGAAANQAACDAIAGGNAGRITLCFNPAEDQSIRGVFISGTDNSGGLIYKKPVSAD